MKTTETDGDQGGEWKVLAELLGIDGPGVNAAPQQVDAPGVKLGPVLVKPLRAAEENASWLDAARHEAGQHEAGQHEAGLGGSSQSEIAEVPVVAEKQALGKQARDQQELLERGWSALPESYRMPETAPTLEEAQAWCRNLAETHYENFHVASWFLPKALRPHFHAIYAYCRVSDDLGDEVGDPQVAIAMLDMWGEELDACYEGAARHPVFVALAETIKACAIPKEPFADLLIAFRHDQMVTRYETMEDVLEYCQYSANPVGRLVLYAAGEAEIDQEEKFRLSDATCTALQLANFWQDVREDWGRGRVYIPQKDMEVFHVTEATIAEGIATDQFRGLLRTEVEYARELFEEGLPLIGMVERELAIDLDLFSRGGLEILRAIEERDFDVLSERPAIAKSRKAGLAMRAVAAKLLPFLSLGGGRRRETAD